MLDEIVGSMTLRYPDTYATADPRFLAAKEPCERGGVTAELGACHPIHDVPLYVGAFFDDG